MFAYLGIHLNQQRILNYFNKIMKLNQLAYIWYAVLNV